MVGDLSLTCPQFIQADTSSCMCRAPRSKSCIQPSIKPSIHPSKPTHIERSRGHSPLIPGLPDDLAIACLVRVPCPHLQALRRVCRRWHRLLHGNHFYALRSSLRLAEEWVYVMKRDRHGSISCRAFDPHRQRWQPVPPVPCEYSEALGFGSAVLSGHRLYVFGGRQPDKPSMRRVVFYSARTNKWHRAPDMLRRRAQTRKVVHQIHDIEDITFLLSFADEDGWSIFLYGDGKFK